jgi:hypothetical protein
MSTKVYCRNCQHFNEGEEIPFSYGPPEHFRELCLAPENFKESHREDNELPISEPVVINRFNDCIWYEAIEEDDGSSSSSSSSSSCDILDMPQ